MITRRTLEDGIGLILLFGTCLALLLVTLGGSWYLWQNANLTISFGTPDANNYPHNMKEIWLSIRTLTPLDIVQLGLFTLVLTQILRVMLLLMYYIQQRDRWFTLISTFILFVLLYSFIWRH